MTQIDKIDLKLKELRRKKRELKRKEERKARESFAKICSKVSPSVRDSLFELVGKTIIISKDGREHKKTIDEKKLDKVLEYILSDFLDKIKIIS